jgi:pyruvate dehydrogenase E2 component (dihydrolipoamide acetyltransferase)
MIDGGTFEYAMPSLGADMDEGRVIEWRVAPGDTVHRGDLIAVVETEKSDIDIDSSTSARRSLDCAPSKRELLHHPGDRPCLLRRQPHLHPTALPLRSRRCDGSPRPLRQRQVGGSRRRRSPAGWLQRAVSTSGRFTAADRGAR